jgi:transcriptional repressor NrdR
MQCPFCRHSESRVVDSRLAAGGTCNKRQVPADRLEELAETLERELAESGEREVASRVIGERVMQRLKTLDEVAYVRFASVYKSFRDIDDFMEEMSRLVRSRSTE